MCKMKDSNRKRSRMIRTPTPNAVFISAFVTLSVSFYPPSLCDIDAFNADVIVRLAGTSAVKFGRLENKYVSRD